MRAAALLALLPVVWAVTVGAFHDRGFAVDDSFISYRFARNLADGFGLSWNPGAPPCEGYTNFLYVVMVAAFVRMGVPAPIAGLAVGIAASLAILVLAWRLLRPARWASLACAALAILWLWRPEPRVHASRGLETALFVALIGLLLAQTKCTPIAGGGRRGAKLAALAATSVALVLCRPDGLLIVAIAWPVLVLAARLADGAWSRAWFGALAACAAAIGGYVAWKGWYFGYLLPNSYYAKAVLPGWPGFADTRRFVAEHAPALLLGIAAMALHVVVTIVAPLCRGRALRDVARGELRPTIALVATAAWLAYDCKIVHEMGYHHRFAQPVVVLVLVGAGYALSDLGRRLPTGRVAFVVAGAAWLGAAAWSWRPVVDEVRRPFGAVEVDPFVAMFERLGRGIRDAAAGRPLLFTCTHAGATPYYADVEHVDPGGLVTDAFNRRNTLREIREYRDRLRPDVICTHLFPASPGAARLDDDARAMASSYVRWCLVGDSSVDALARYDIEQRSDARQREMFELMAFFRDECTLVGEMEFGVRRWREFVYVVKERPLHDDLAARLRAVVDIPAEQITYDGWPER